MTDTPPKTSELAAIYKTHLKDPLATTISQSEKLLEAFARLEENEKTAKFVAMLSKIKVDRDGFKYKPFHGSKNLQDVKDVLQSVVNAEKGMQGLFEAAEKTANGQTAEITPDMSAATLQFETNAMLGTALRAVHTAATTQNPDHALDEILVSAEAARTSFSGVQRAVVSAELGQKLNELIPEAMEEMRGLSKTIPTEVQNPVATPAIEQQQGKSL